MLYILSLHFVEFFVAQWLLKAQHVRVYKNFAKFLYKKSFRENKLHILDILSEVTVLHCAALQSDIFKVEKRLATKPACCNMTDKLGGTILHELAICCRRFNAEYIFCFCIEQVIQLMQQNCYDTDRSDTIMGWNWTDYLPDDFLKHAFDEFLNTVKLYASAGVQNINLSASDIPTSNFKLFDGI